MKDVGSHRIGEKASSQTEKLGFMRFRLSDFGAAYLNNVNLLGLNSVGPSRPRGFYVLPLSRKAPDAIGKAAFSASREPHPGPL